MFYNKTIIMVKLIINQIGNQITNQNSSKRKYSHVKLHIYINKQDFKFKSS